jgi:hypothetical protein
MAVPAVSNAAQCGPGTFYDAPTDTCLVESVSQLPPPLPGVPPPPPPLPGVPPPPPPPAWNGPTPWVSASVCAPIPILNLCVGV